MSRKGSIYFILLAAMMVLLSGSELSAQCNEFYIYGSPASASCKEAVEDVVWINASSSVHNTIAGNTLTKFNSNNNWDGNGFSYQSVADGGYMQTSVIETNKSRMIGLSSTDVNSNFTSIQYAFYLVNTGSLQIYESGTLRGTFGTYVASDILKISVENSILKYYQNGNLLYISNTAPTLPMFVDVSTRHSGATVSEVKISNGNIGVFNASGTNAGTSPNYQWQLNGINVGTNSATYTNTSLSSGDSITCIQTSAADGCLPFTVYNSNSIIIGNIDPTLLNGFYITGVPTASTCKETIEDVVWNPASSAAKNTITGNNLVKETSDGNWDGNGFSFQSVSNNGYMIFSATETDKDRTIGLSSTDASVSNTSIEFAFRLRTTGALNIYESGTNRGTFGTYLTGDALKIAVENNVVKYYRNGTMIYISSVSPTLPLYVDVSLRNVGATATAVQVANGNTGTFSAVALNLGPAPTYQWTINGSPVGTNSSSYTNNALPNSDLINCIITPDLGGCASSSYTSNVISLGDINPTLQNEFYIAGSPASSACKEAVVDVVWMVTASGSKNYISGNTLTKMISNGTWDGNGFSAQSVSNNGYMQTIVAETNETRMIGLSATDVNGNYTSIQYAFFLTNTGALQIYESGASRGTFGTYSTNDTLKIAVENNIIKYYKNSTSLYISNVAPTLPLYVDVSTNSTGATLSDVKVSNGNISTFTAYGTNLGTAPVYQWQLNGSNVGTNSTTYTNTALNSFDVITCLVTPDLGGCSSSAFTSNSIVVKDINQTQQNEFYITGTPSLNACKESVVDVVWVIASSGVKNTIRNNTLTKRTSNGVWDGNGFSYQSVSNNGYMQTTVAETNKARMIGLSATDLNGNFTSIQFSFYLMNTGSLRIYESGTNRGTFGTYAATDILKIAVENSVVKYYKNGALIYTSTVSPTLPLYVDVSTNATGATANNVKVSNGNISTFTAYGTNLGVAPTYQWQLNGSNVGSNSTSYTNSGLVDGDAITCIVTPDLGGCSNSAFTSNSVSVLEPANTTTTWIGTTSAWNTVSNWSNGVPTKYKSAIITAGTNPVISTNAVVNNITIGAGKTLTINASRTLDVYGNIDKVGTFTANTSTVKLYGCSNPTTITSTTGISFYNLVIDNSYGINLSGTFNATITNSLSLLNGIVSTGTNYLIVSSTTAGNLTYTNGFVNGNLRRNIATNTSTYNFPVGNGTSSTDRHIVSLLNNSLTGVTYINASVSDFTQSAPNSDALLNTYQGTVPIIATVGEAVGETVIWSLTPNVQPSGGTYGVQLAVENTTLSAAEDNYFCPLKRTTVISYASFSTFDLSTNIPGGGNPGRIYSSGSGYAERTGYTSFSHFVIGKGNGVPLPIELSYFNATLQGEIVTLNWGTASERNNSFFTIEKSRDAEFYEKLCDVESKANGGNSTTLLNYSTEDIQPYEGRSYYRLKQTDFDGRTTYSEPVSVTLTRSVDFNLNIYPNPSSGEELTFAISSQTEQPISIVIYDLNGKEYFSELLNAETERSFVLSPTANGITGKGIYFVRAISGSVVKCAKLILK